MKKWLREPLLHFLLLGGLIFFAYGILNQQGPAEGEIFVSKGQQQNLINTFERTWQRLPTPVEYQGLLRDYIRQEIAYRESRELGLDQGDIVIRRRMRQKMEMLAEDVAGLVPPTEAELESWLDANPEPYRVEPRLSLRQLYFSTDRRGESAVRDAQDALAAIESQGETAEFAAMGDPIPLPEALEDAGESEIARLFGEEFAQGLRDVPTGRWVGPIPSGFGVHLVYIDNREKGRAADLAEVRDAVQRDLMNDRRNTSVDRLYEKLAENYVIEIEPLTNRGEGGAGTP